MVETLDLLPLNQDWSNRVLNIWRTQTKSTEEKNIFEKSLANQQA